MRFADDESVRRLAQRLAAMAGRRLDDSAPFADLRLPDGSRCHAVLAPVSRPGTAISLRVPPARAFTLDELLAAGTLTRRGAELLRALVAARVAFLVSGGTGSGKTTLLAALLSLVDPGRAARPRRGRLRAAPRPSARRRARGPAGQRRGRGRHRAAHPGPAGAADAARPAGRRRGPRRRGGRPAGRAQHRPRRWLRHPARQLRRSTCRPGSRRSRWPPASTGRRPTASSRRGSPRWCTWRAGATACGGWPRSRCPAAAPTGSSRWSRPSRWSTGRSATVPGAAELARVLGR